MTIFPKNNSLLEGPRLQNSEEGFGASHHRHWTGEAARAVGGSDIHIHVWSFSLLPLLRLRAWVAPGPGLLPWKVLRFQKYCHSLSPLQTKSRHWIHWTKVHLNNISINDTLFDMDTSWIHLDMRKLLEWWTYAGSWPGTPAAIDVKNKCGIQLNLDCHYNPKLHGLTYHVLLFYDTYLIFLYLWKYI